MNDKTEAKARKQAYFADERIQIPEDHNNVSWSYMNVIFENYET